VEEVTHIAGHHEELHLHLVDTETEPRLTVEDVLATAGGEPHELSAFLCGPESMVNAMQKGLVKAGVKAANVHREYYNLR
jgi:predicted ferric reductase